VPLIKNATLQWGEVSFTPQLIYPREKAYRIGGYASPRGSLEDVEMGNTSYHYYWESKYDFSDF
jgi:hypothetical protein